LFGKGEFPGRALKFLVWLLQLRTDKNAKIETVGSMTFNEATNWVTEYLADPKAPA
jgi:hypothetical protein